MKLTKSNNVVAKLGEVLIDCNQVFKIFEIGSQVGLLCIALYTNDACSVSLDIHKVLCDLRPYLLEDERAILPTYWRNRARNIN